MRNMEPKKVTVAEYARVAGVSARSARNWCAAFIADSTANPLPAPGIECRRRGKRDYVVTVDAAEYDRLKAAAAEGPAGV